MRIFAREFITVLFMTTSTLAATLPTGEKLPELKGEFLSGKEAVLPQAATGKVSLLLLGFTYDSRHAVEQWAGQFRKDFGQHPRVTFFEIPMIGGMARMGKWFIDSGMRRGTPKADHEHVITVYGGTAPWKERVGFTKDEFAYLLVLDPEGRVAWCFNGLFDDAAYRELSARMNALLK